MNLSIHFVMLFVNSVPSNDAIIVVSWSLHKPIGIDMRGFNTRRYTLVHGFCFFFAVFFN